MATRFEKKLKLFHIKKQKTKTEFYDYQLVYIKKNASTIIQNINEKKKLKIDIFKILHLKQQLQKEELRMIFLHLYL